MSEPPLFLRKTLRWGDGLALVVGIMIGAGIFRTPGIVAGSIGRPALTFLAWALGGAVGLLGVTVRAGGCQTAGSARIALSALM